MMPVSIDRWKWCTFTMLPVFCCYCSAAGPLEAIRTNKRTLCAHLCVTVPSGSEFRLGTALRLLLPSLSCNAGEGLARFSKIPQTLLQKVSQKGWDVVVGTSVVFQKAGDCHELWVLRAGMPWDWLSPGAIGIPNSSVPPHCPCFLWFAVVLMQGLKPSEICVGKAAICTELLSQRSCSPGFFLTWLRRGSSSKLLLSLVGDGRCGEGWRAHQETKQTAAFGTVHGNSLGSVFRHRWWKSRGTDKSNVCVHVWYISVWYIQNTYLCVPVLLFLVE